jgi:hypothetical protein
MAFLWFRNLFLKPQAQSSDYCTSTLAKQVNAWQKANRKMSWGIMQTEFEKVKESSPPALTKDDWEWGFNGLVLFYGFGDDGQGNSDAVVSGKIAWEYAGKKRKSNIWQCEYINFGKPDDIRLRPGAPPRPKGFYYAKINTGQRNLNLTVAQVRKKLANDTGWGPEGFQFLAITHPHFADLMNQRKIPFMALADYDVAPYGYNDFFDSPQLFCGNKKLGLGIGNIDRNYPLFGIPTLQL